MDFLSYNTFFHKIWSMYLQTCIESLGWALGVKECLSLILVANVFAQVLYFKFDDFLLLVMCHASLQVGCSSF